MNEDTHPGSDPAGGEIAYLATTNLSDRPASEADDSDQSDATVNTEIPTSPPPRGRGARVAAAAERARHPAVFVDSSAMVAIVDRDDASHQAAVDAYRELVDAGYRLFTTNYVMAETYDLLLGGVGPSVARRWLRDCRLAVYHADEQDEKRARTVAINSTSQRGISMTDAISVVVMERLGVADAFAVDPNFLADTDT